MAEVTEKNKIKISFIARSKGNESLESIQWLNFTSKKLGVHITHGLNGQEKMVGTRNYRLDGYAEVTDQSGSILSIGFDYRGCRWHPCPFNCATKQIESVCEKKDKERIAYLQKHLDQYKTIQSCRWMEERKTIDDEEGPEFYPFLMKDKIAYEDLLSIVMEKKFFGFVHCDVTSPQEIIDKNKATVKLPPIFSKTRITENMVPEEYRGKTKFPTEVNTLIYNETEGLYTSEQRGLKERQLGPYHIRSENMSTEYATEMLEVTSRHRVVHDDALVQIAFWVLQNSKLLMFRFIFELEEHFIPGFFQKCYTDTDSILYALTSTDIEECIKPERKQSWEDFKTKWFSVNTTVSQKTPGLFKKEWEMINGTYIGLSSKCYGLYGENITDNKGHLVKTGTKGINKEFTITVEEFKNELLGRSHKEVVVGNFAARKGQMKTWQTTKSALNAFYRKQIVCDDKITVENLKSADGMDL
ncbi:unnamed protein product [Oikopleura dioica]|uniref:DNA-directed DNA polymerase n=1 Tax=Oikopleura dioica TaxID=34765 RepID=E4XZE9_OIKDI|nr:unnamed protein product [Oikopleura dioica]